MKLPSQHYRYRLLTKRLVQYMALVDNVYTNLNDDAARLALTSGYDGSKAFKWSDYPITADAVNLLQANYVGQMSAVINAATTQEWHNSNLAQDLIASNALKSYDATVRGAKYTKYYLPNNDALKAFQNRAIGGMNLSQKLWVQSEDYKNALEATISVAIERGTSAVTLSKMLSKYLVDFPQLQKDYTEKYGRAADIKNCHYNSMRLARSEINMAYRTAEQERWNQMDFIVGKEIKTTQNGKHEADVCDDLAGKYPKDFKWVGWHPNCMCYEIPILKTDDEFWALGSEDSTNSVNEVTDVPDGFNNWITRNQDRIAQAEERGTLPYFIADNQDYVSKALKGAEVYYAPLSDKDLRYFVNQKLATEDEIARNATEIAAARHAARTKEDIERITKAFNERQSIIKEGNEVLKSVGGIADVDTNTLKDALKKAQWAKVKEQIKSLRDIETEILALDKLDNPLSVARSTSFKTAKQINDNVTRTLRKMSADLSARKASLEYEVQWMESEGKKRYPVTYKYAQEAYKRELAIVQRKLDIKDIADSVDDALTFAATSRSKIIKALASEMKTLLASDSATISDIRDKAKELNKKYQQLNSKPKVKGIETLEDIKKRLGNNTPKTLEELDEAIMKYAYTGPQFKKVETEINALMKKLFDDNDFGMDIKHQFLDSVFDKGFLNTFQVGSSQGANYSTKTKGAIEETHGRLIMAHRMFKPSTHSHWSSWSYTGPQLQRKEYEKYGHLLDRDKLQAYLENKTWYGDVQVRFKKDRVLPTWTFNDSLHKSGEYYQPSLCTDPRVESFDKAYKVPQKNNSWDKLHQWQREMGTSYIELQYHGELTIDMVESMTFGANPETLITKSLIQKLKSKGIELWYIESGKLLRYH